MSEICIEEEIIALYFLEENFWFGSLCTGRMVYVYVHVCMCVYSLSQFCVTSSVLNISDAYRPISDHTGKAVKAL